MSVTRIVGFFLAMAGISELEETIKKLQSHKGVKGILIVNSEGIPIRSNLEGKVAVQYAAHLTRLVAKTKTYIRELDPTNDLNFIRLRSKQHELVIAPDPQYMLCVIQESVE